MNLLLAGSPSTSKTFMLKLVQQQIEEQNPNSTLFIDCATSTFSGLVAELDRIKPQFIFLDELTSFDYKSQRTLLNLLQNQTIHLNKHRNNKTIYLPHLKVIGSCNDLGKLLEPLRSRMLILYLRAPNELEYMYIARKMLKSQFEYLDDELADYIGRKTWQIKPPYLRLVARIGAMIKHEPTKEKVDKIIENLKRYSVPKEELLKMKIQR
ncbi:MAG: ATP-binding protein [Nitrososphaeraceae archaeon]